MSIDFPSVNPVVTPPVPEKVFPLYWMRKLSVDSPGPTSPARLYSEFQPYRRITGDVVDPNTGDVSEQVLGSEIKTPEVQGDVKVVVVPDIFAIAGSAEGQDELVAQAIQSFAMQGGNVAALAMAALFLAIREYGTQTGVFAQE